MDVRSRLRRFCRPARNMVLSATAAAAFTMPFVTQCAPTGPIVQGQTFVNAYCSEDGKGIYFTQVLTGFPGNYKFHYQVIVTWNGGQVHNYPTSNYYTTYLGDHHGNGRTYVCACYDGGLYTVTVWAVGADGRYLSSSGWDEVACT